MTPPGPTVGSLAPDFTLKDQNNEELNLASFRGSKAVLIIFYPLAFTGTCSRELARVQENLADFENDELQVVTISVDSAYSHKIFSQREGYEFPLLADFWPHGAVAQAYGAFNDAAGFANRATFLVDRDGVIRFRELNGPGEARDPDVWLAAIKTL